MAANLQDGVIPPQQDGTIPQAQRVPEPVQLAQVYPAPPLQQAPQQAQQAAQLPQPGPFYTVPRQDPPTQVALPATGLDAIQQLTALLQSSVRRMEALEEGAASSETARTSHRMLREAQSRQEVDLAFSPIREISSPDKNVANQLRNIKFISSQLQEASFQLAMLSRLPEDAAQADWLGYARAAAAATYEGNKALLIYSTSLSRVHDLGPDFACASAAKVMASELDSFSASAGFAPAFQDAWTKQEDRLEKEKERAATYKARDTRPSAQARRGARDARHRSPSPTEPNRPAAKRKLDAPQANQRGGGTQSSRGRGSSSAPLASA